MDNNNNQNNGQKNNDNKGSKFNQTLLILLIAAVFTYLGMSCMSNFVTNASTKEISYTEFLEMIEEDKVEKVEYTSDKIIITPKSDENSPIKMTYYTGYIYQEDTFKLLNEKGIRYSHTIEESNAFMDIILMYVIPFLFVYLLFTFVFRRMAKGGGMMGGVGKSNAKMYVQKQTGVTFKDVAGQDEAKESLTEIVDFLHNPDKYNKIGAKLPKGALLIGPPGTGKTLLARAVAGEAKVPFFSLSGSDFVEMYVGVGASRVRDLFKQAQASAPCIVFIDEIDAIGKSRDSKMGNDEREQTLNQLLSEMDGFDPSKGLLILAATNRPEVLDKALLRPGRFDRRIIVDKPDLKGRLETLRVHSKDVLMDDSVDLEKIALATSGAVGSDLANMINEAAINAVKNGRKFVNQNDLFEAVEVVIAGKEKKDRILSDKEKRIVAYHECGHALITAVKKNSDPVQKITIVPRTMGSLGYVMPVPEEERYLETKDEYLVKLVTYMAGRAAEKVKFNVETSGAASDIQEATKIARHMVLMLGMSDKFGMMALADIENRYLDGRAAMNCAETTQADIDEEVRRLLKNAYDEAIEIVSNNIDVLDKTGEYLFEKETITGEEFMQIYREVKGISEEADTISVNDETVGDNDKNSDTGVTSDYTL